MGEVCIIYSDRGYAYGQLADVLDLKSSGQGSTPGHDT